jgi:hypothetical protein
MRKFERDLRRLARDYGAILVTTNGNHLCVVGYGWKVFCANTPSDYRAIRNIKLEIKRAAAQMENQ